MLLLVLDLFGRIFPYGQKYLEDHLENLFNFIKIKFERIILLPDKYLLYSCIYCPEKFTCISKIETHSGVTLEKKHFLAINVLRLSQKIII